MQPSKAQPNNVPIILITISATFAQTPKQQMKIIKPIIVNTVII